jgi:hypothetical protein
MKNYIQYNLNPLIVRELNTLYDETGLNINTHNAKELILKTILVESGGVYRYQINGPALGICQIEPATHKDVLNRTEQKYPTIYNYIIERFYPNSNLSRGFAFDDDIVCDDNLLYNDSYSIIIARMKYYLIPEKLPNDLQGLAEYWKKYYNTELGKGEVEKFINV